MNLTNNTKQEFNNVLHTLHNIDKKQTNNSNSFRKETNMVENNKVKVGVIEAQVLKVGVIIKWSYEPCYDIRFMKKFVKLAIKYPHIIEVSEFTWVLTDRDDLDDLISIESKSVVVINREVLEDEDEYNNEFYEDYNFYILEANEIINN